MNTLVFPSDNQYIVHNQANLHDYDLFCSRNNNHLRLAFMISPGVIELKEYSHELVSHIHELFLAEYDYSAYDRLTDTFALKAHRKIKADVQKNTIVLFFDNFTEQADYVLIFRNETASVFHDPTPGGIIDTHYNAFDEQDFGVQCIENKAKFKIWSPPASRVELLLFYPDGRPVVSSDPILMQKGSKGVWMCELTAPENDPCYFEGHVYQYRVYAYGKARIALDPYAFSMAPFHPQGKDNIGKGVIVNINSPKSIPDSFVRKYSNKTAMANENDIIAWEMHVRDFTSQPGIVSTELAGTYLGFAEKIQYIKELGVTHVQLMPVMKFYTVNENDRNFSAKDTVDINYNWGYDPLNFFTPEGWFSTDASNPYSRIFELRSLIQALHDAGIGVILDVVFNHTHIVETFEHIAPGCYYRYTDELKISGHTGAGPTLESRRQMVRKLITDALLHFINHYHVDGFRFDLMSFMDHDTMNMIYHFAGNAYSETHPDSLILQGEAWVFSDLNTGSASASGDSAITKLNYPVQLKTLGIFNDVCRDSVCGMYGLPGFVSGNDALIDRVFTVVAGAKTGFNLKISPDENNQLQDPYALFALSVSNCLNFLSVHDGLTLWDNMNVLMGNTDTERKLRAMRMAALIVFTSCGKIILHGGDEMLRTKPLADFDREPYRALISKNRKSAGNDHHLHENSYSSPDYTNMFRWIHEEKKLQDEAKKMNGYYRGLISMRRSFPAFRSEPEGSSGSNLRILTKKSDDSGNAWTDAGSDSSPNQKKLTICFINGPAEETFYLAGEVHPHNVSDNPEQNPFAVHFDKFGNGSISFDEQTINTFDISKWSDSSSLMIKLVKQPESWETIPGAYTPYGNNIIELSAISQGGCFVIDLSEADFHATLPLRENKPTLAYIFDNDPSQPAAKGISNAQYDKILVIHNPSFRDIEFVTDELSNPSSWDVIADVLNAGTSKLVFSKEEGAGMTQVLVSKNTILVPAYNSVVAARKRT